jgi:ABC-type transport system involved in cytochrome c biogenesis permease subunit
MTRASFTIVAVALVAAMALSPARIFAGDLFDQSAADFVKQLDIRQLELLPVQMDGRVAILDTLARRQMRQITGRETFDGLPAAAAYLELYFNAGAYLDKPVLLVKERAVREAIAAAMPDAGQKELLRTSRLAPAALMTEQAYAQLELAGRLPGHRLPATAPALRDALETLYQQAQYRMPLDKLGQRHLAFIQETLRMIPDPSGNWVAPSETYELYPAPDATGPAARPMGRGDLGLANRLRDLGELWRQRDAKKINQWIADFAKAQAESATLMRQPLPSPAMRSAELSYNRASNSTLVWVGFALATVLLILAVGGLPQAESKMARWSRRAGMAVLTFSTLLLLAGFIVRWLLSGQAWYLPPIMNQFEAVVGSALLAGILGSVLGWRPGWRTCLALAAALWATLALLASYFLSDLFGSAIKPPPGILSSPVMAVHVSVIIIGHAMVGMTFFLSVAYLIARMVSGIGGKHQASALHMPNGQTPPSRLGGATQMFNRCNLIVAQLAAWMVMVGTFLGAYWADFAWGRWWGWDAKEVWAMMTALLFIAILHLRMVVPARHRGWVTAALCILGTAIMLFNWIGVNYFLTGMHSYA